MQAAGDVRSALVTRYPDGRSKGWGLVEFVDASSAADVIANYNDMDLLGRKIFSREDRDTGAGGEGGGGGGGKGGGGGSGRRWRRRRLRRRKWQHTRSPASKNCAARPAF